MAAQTRNLTCINCPIGCQLAITLEGACVTGVSGNQCPRGDAYARSEVSNPTRTVTTTVGVRGSSSRRLPVKTADRVPKASVPDVIDALAHTEAVAPVAIGEVVCANVADTGIDVVATASLV